MRARSPARAKHRHRPTLCLIGLSTLLGGCVDDLDTLPDDGAIAADARDDGQLDRAPNDAAPAPDVSVDHGLDGDSGPACAPLDAAEALTPPLLIDRGPCPDGHAIRLLAPAGAALTARLLPLDDPSAGAVELWWPDDAGWLRADRIPLADDPELRWIAPAEGAVLQVHGARWRLAVDVAEPQTRPVEITGRIIGWQRAVSNEGLAEPSPFETVGARVDLLDAQNRWSDITRVAADGGFTLSGALVAGPGTVRLLSEGSALGVPIRIGPDGELPWAESIATVDGPADVDARLDPQGATAAAWFVARTAAQAFAALGPWLPIERVDPPPVRFRWRPGFSEACGSCFRPGPRPLIDLGGRLSDPDEWDRAIIVHELGHYVAAIFSRDDSGGGPHDGSPIEPAIAWSEGLATFLASWPAAPLQLDYKLAGVARLDLEAMDQPEAFGTADGTVTGRISERLVAALLWDLHDDDRDDSPDDDPLTLTADRLFAPLFDRLAGDWQDVGAPGIDLLDYLEALACDGIPPGLRAVLDGRALPHDPLCRQKSHGPLTARRLAAHRVELSAAVDGILRMGGRQQPVVAGQSVVWPMPPGVLGATLDHHGGRAVLPLSEPERPLRPIVRRAGAWELAPVERVNAERRPPAAPLRSDRPARTAASGAAASDRAAD